MATNGRRVSVTDEPTLLTTHHPEDTKSGKSLVITVVTASKTVDLGGADVAAGGGFPISTGGIFSVDQASNEDVYAVCASGTVEVAVFEEGV